VEVLTNSGEVRVLTADTVVIDTGSRPADPPLPGLQQIEHFNSTTIMELDEVPEHLVILGGGYIAVEFAQLFRRLGSAVTILQRGGYLLEREDTDVSDAVRDIFREDGIEVLFNAAVESAKSTGPKSVTLTATLEGERCAVTGSHLLVATGRKLNTEALNLQAAGVQLGDHGAIRVNGRLETTAPGIYAAGEVAGSPAFTHISYDDFRILRTNLIDGGDATTEGRLIPYTVFIDPQLGRVGMSEREANERGQRYLKATMAMNHVARALEMDETRGFIKALLDPDSKQILGAAVLGIEGGEIMAMFQIAMMGKLQYPTLYNGIFAHPTLAELFGNLFSHVE
jgi:pyruvate/2-oxoglutarate dehydrogenase complex dihydrolipoamide dehydrogenase (E3) component